MTSQEFIEEFIDILQTDEEITLDSILDDLEDWDSISLMACQTWFDVKLGIKLSFVAFAEAERVQDIINLSQGKIA